MPNRSYVFMARPVGLAALAATVACSTPPSGGDSTGNAPAPAAKSNPAALTPIARSLHPLARPDLDVGRRDPAVLTAGSIYLKPSAAQAAEREALVAAIQDPASPSYHKWLSAEDYAARFGASQADLARVTEWLKSQGLTVDGPSRIGTRIGFRGTGAQVEAAFHTEMHNYVIKGQTHYAMSRAPMVPNELAPLVLGLHGFHDFRLHHPQIRPVHHPDTQDPIYGETALGPSDFATLYNTKPLIAAGTTGKGVNLIIVGQTYINPTDLSNFRSHFGITGVNQVDVLVPNTGTSNVNDQGDLGESELDLEWASAVAPGANIVFVYTGSDRNFSVDDAAAYAIEEGAHLVPGTGNGAAQIISESYGGCDYFYAGSDADIDSEIAAAANLEGITYLASSGDSGASECLGFGVGGLYVGPPSSLPGITGVGGTEFCGKSTAGCFYAGAAAQNVQTTPFFVNQNAAEYPQTAQGVSLEGIWNDSTAANGPGAGGGGASSIFAKPSYQQGVTGMPNDGARDVPDISLTASANNVGYLVWEPTQLADGGPADTLGPVGGTSASTPSFAGILALVNQAVAAGGGSLGLGNVNPQLYTMFSQNASLGSFHDIVTGDNTTPCDPTDQTNYPGCPIPAGTDAGALPDGGAAFSTYGGYSAHVGYDLASGLGTVDAQKLVTAWAALTPTTTTLAGPTTAPVGTAVTLTATITSSSATNVNPVGGSVTFAFKTLAGDAGAPYAVDAGGATDESWILGTVNVTAASGTPEKATATLSTAIPPGLLGQAYVVAEYSGDNHYLASISKPPSPVSVPGSTLVVNPSSITLPPNGQTTFAVSGGSPGVVWGYIGPDTSCLPVPKQQPICSAIESLTPTTAAFQAGGQAGSVTIVATDTQGQEALVHITVAGAAVDAGSGLPVVDDAGPAGGPGNPPLSSDGGAEGGTPDSGAPVDAGGPHDAGLPVDSGGMDATSTDAGADAGTSSGGGGGGCGCAVAGSENEGSKSGVSLAGMLFGLAVLGRRRQRKK